MSGENLGNPVSFFEHFLSDAQRAVMDGLDSPLRVQAFLDSTVYGAENVNRCPLSVLRDGVAHCLDGALFAVAALRRLGYPPLVVDLLPAPGTDDDHVLAVFQCEGRWGAVAKSNFVGLRFREPVYCNLRELSMSYFESYFNIDGLKTLRGYTRPFNLAALDRLGWMWSDAGADAVEKRLYTLKAIPLLSETVAARLSPVDEITYRAGMLVVNPAGLYQPHHKGELGGK